MEVSCVLMEVGVMNGNISLLNNFVSVSDFSQGKANKIFKDVSENDQEYIVLKNNKPAAVVLSVSEYEKTNERIRRLEAIVEKILDLHLLYEAEIRNTEDTVPFEEIVKEEGLSMEELEVLAESVNIE